MKQREPVYDVMKGIGIILMLVGHMPIGDRAFRIIYSFHMPLFFLIAGVFADLNLKSGIKIGLKKDFKRLVLPVFVTMLFVAALSPLVFFVGGGINNVIKQLLSMLWLGDAFVTKWGKLNIDSLWFLMALFWGRFLFRCIGRLFEGIRKWHDEIILLCCILLSILAIFLHKVLPPIPWGVLLGLSALQFYAIGWYLKQHKQPRWLYVVFFVVWLFALEYGGVNMVKYYYRCYPLDVLGAIGATWLVYLVSKAICTYTVKTNKLFRWFGVNSLAILCVNTLDRKTHLVRAIKHVLGINLIGMNSVLFHYAIEAVLVIVLVSIPFFRRIYGAKQWKEI